MKNSYADYFQSIIVAEEEDAELECTFFDICTGCSLCRNVFDMSVPQGVFAAKKIRQNIDKMVFYDEEKQGGGASRYNSKYMNSIWGMYNRFSVHNLKKIMDDNQAQPGNFGQTGKGLKGAQTWSVSSERLPYLPM